MGERSGEGEFFVISGVEAEGETLGGAGPTMAAPDAGEGERPRRADDDEAGKRSVKIFRPENRPGDEERLLAGR